MAMVFPIGYSKWGGTTADIVVTAFAYTSEINLLRVGGVPVQVWDGPAPDGMPVHDLRDNMGDQILTLRANADGTIPEFWIPNTVPEPWVQTADGPRLKLVIPQGIKGDSGDLTPVARLDDVSGAVDLSHVTGPLTVHMRLVGDVTDIITPPLDPDVAFLITLLISQDSVGGRTARLVNRGSSYAVPIELSTAPNARDRILLLRDGETEDAVLSGQTIGIPAEWTV